MMNFTDILKRTSRRLDANQLAAIDCDDKNSVVSAGAGSGKTTVLSYRFLRLVVEGKAHVDEILTLTFTRKAAAEMHERIHQQLLEYRDDPDVAKELARFPDAAISTLDSFCSRIVRCDCVRYGISPDYTTDDETCRRLASLCAVQALEEHAQEPGVLFLSSLYSPENLVDEFLVPYAMSYFTFTEPLRATVAADTVLGYFLEACRNTYAELMGLARQVTTLTDFSSSPVQRAVEVCQRLVDVLPPLMEAGDWNEIQRLCSTGVLNWSMMGASNKKPDCVTLKEIVPVYRETLERFQVATTALAQQEHMLPMFQFLELYQNQFFEQKRKAGILTFSDVSLMAVDILQTNKSLRAYFKKKFRYIMIDEFQDNNSLQKNLLYLLAERVGVEHDGIPAADMLDPGKLFFVGDEKQSIYRFRGADVSVFKELKNELGATGGLALSLDTNYRSEPRLIEQFNKLFGNVMKNEGEPWEADFAPLGTRKPSPGVTPSCTLCFKPLESFTDGSATGTSVAANVRATSTGATGTDTAADDALDEEQAQATEAEAMHLAELIATMLEGDSYLIPDGKGGTRRPKPNDIAMLLKSTGGQLSYEKALRARGIPYTLQLPRALLLEAPANDLYNLLQLALYPSDKLAYAASLRSPFCRLSDQGVATVLKRYASPLSSVAGIPYPDSNDILQELKNEFSDDDYTRYAIATGIFNGLVERVGRVPVTSLLSYLWYDCCYRNYLVSHVSYQTYLEHYDFLWMLARQYDQRGDGLSMFLDFLRPRLGENEKLTDVELLHEEIQGVQIMTIHKSKGLEFPIVIVAGMGAKGEREATPCFYPCAGIALPSHMEATVGRKTVVNGCYFLEKERRTKLAQAELKRLLYVAATRAETHLVFSGCENVQNHGDNAALSNLLYMFIRNSDIDISAGISNDPDIAIRIIGDVPAESLYSHAVVPLAEQTDIDGKRDWYRNAMIRNVDVSPLRYGVTALVGAGVEFVPVDESNWHPAPEKQLPILQSDRIMRENGLATRFGTYAHAVVEQLVKGVSVDSSPSRLASLFPDSKPDTLPLADFHQILADGLSLARNFMASDLWREISAYAGATVECEVPFFARIIHEGNPVLVEGFIDLLVTLPDRQYIVDFKTDALRESAVHERQIRTYMEAMHRISGLPVYGTVCFLRHPGDETWWEL